MRCLSCQTDNPVAARFCLHCGSILTLTSALECPRCHAPLPPKARFCSSCGAEASSAAPSRSSSDRSTIPQSLQRYLPAGYVEKLMAAKGHVEGERRVVTILFSDVKGSTALADSLDPEEVMEIMNGVFEMLIEPITRYEGTLARLMGDAIMAFFGAPISHEDDPHRACRAALEIIEGAKRMARTLETERGIRGFDVRVGINTGLVVVAEVGADLRVEYTAMGDAVNLAARMEGLAEPGTILITDATRRGLGDAFQTESLGPMRIKGKTEPVVVYRLVGSPESHHPNPSARRVRSPLVGRDEELKHLDRRISSLKGNAGGICTIVGEGGLGKSRLILEARTREGSNCLWAETRSLAYTQGTSYATARQLLTALLGGHPKEPPEALATILRNDLEERSPVLLPEIFPYLSLMIGLPLEANTRQRLQALEAELLQQRIYHAFRTYLRLRAATHPVILVWEDLQWIDPSSLALLESLLPLLAEAPILCILTYRLGEERAEAFSALAQRLCASRCEAIELKPLPDTESSRLLSNLLGDSPVPDDVRDAILRKTDGNAFFLEEVIRQLYESVDADGGRTGRFLQNSASALSVPDTLRGVIMARIDSLRPQDRHILQTAAVLGRAFGRNLLRHMLEKTDPATGLETSLEELIRRDFVRVQTEEAHSAFHPSPDEELVFAHTLTQNVAYDSLLLAQRRALHRRAAETIEEIYADQLPPYSGVLATHYELAGEQQKALLYLSKAAFLAREVFANQEAIALFMRSLALAEAVGTAPEHSRALHEGIADVLTQGTSYADALKHYRLAEQLTRDPLQQATVLRKQGLLLEKTGEYEEAIKSFEKALMHLRTTADPGEAARIFTGLGRIYSHRGETQSAIDLGLLALDLTQNQSDDWGIAQSCNNLGIIYSKVGDLSKALEYHLKSIEIWTRLKESHGLAISHNNIGLVYHRLGDTQKATDHYRASIELTERTGNQLGLARACDNLSQVLALEGKHEESVQLLEKAVGILGAIGINQGEASPELWLQSGTW